MSRIPEGRQENINRESAMIRLLLSFPPLWGINNAGLCAVARGWREAAPAVRSHVGVVGLSASVITASMAFVKLVIVEALFVPRVEFPVMSRRAIPLTASQLPLLFQALDLEHRLWILLFDQFSIL